MAWGHGLAVYILWARHGRRGGVSRNGGTIEGGDEAVVVSTLPVLRVSCDSRVGVPSLCGVAVARENSKGDEPVDDMLPLRAG
jgi:hypothetical protein